MQAALSACADGATYDYPPALAQAHGFRGRIEYVARRAGGGPPVFGAIDVSPSGWSLDERTAGYALRAGEGGATLNAGANALPIDDPFAADALANAWAVAFGELATGVWTHGAIARSWVGPGGLRAYFDTTGTRIAGVYDAASPTRETFIFDDWIEDGGLSLPLRVLRLRHSVTSAVFLVQRYRVSRAGVWQASVAPQNASAYGDTAAGSTGGAAVGVARPSTAPAASAALSNFFTLFELLLLGAAVVAWFNRDMLTTRLCRRLAVDPRSFRDEGISAFVSPEGILYFDGCSYRIGPLFYGRAARVQTSPLFLRVTANGVSRAVVVARKFKLLERRARSAAFSLIETTVAMAVFLMAIVGSIYPTLAAIARADAFAAKRAAATRIAANALTDEELAAAYGSAIDVGSTTTTIDGMQVTVTVSQARNAGEYDIAVSVSDGAQSLARVATVVGPPVPTPPPQALGG